jgi:hypothetical protein
LETNQPTIQQQIEKDRKTLYEKLMQERFGIATRGDSIPENPKL